VDDITTRNVAGSYTESAFCRTTAVLGVSNANGLIASSNAVILSNGTPWTTLPFPADSTLTLSSLKYPVVNQVYQDPTDPEDFVISATVTPANPNYAASTLVQTLPNVFIDTVSYASYSNFVSSGTTYGQRILSLLPRIESPGIATNIGDGVDANGQSSNGLNVSISSFVVPEFGNTVVISSFLTYQHTSSLIQPVYNDFYARELLYTNGAFVHPAGQNFSPFVSSIYNVPFVYPDFTNDLNTDTNYGYRYATFAYEFPVNTTPTAYRFLNITMENPSLISTIQPIRYENDWWPDRPVVETDVPFMKARMHMKLTGTIYTDVNDNFETAWLNCFKISDLFSYSDDVFDLGACMSVTSTINSVTYKASFNRRFYTKVVALVRVGIPRDGTIISGSEFPLSFTGMRVSLSDA
jgi:hypothetical protein